MPATWNDLSNEIRKIIIEYIVADLTITFAPRHAATRAARKKDEATAQEPPHFPLLLVSKQFLTYAELNDAVLKNATIKYRNKRDLTMLDARFGKGGIENIRSLQLVYRMTWKSSAPLPDVPSKLRSRLKRLQKLTAKIDLIYTCIGNYGSLADLIDVAKGQNLPDPVEQWGRTTESTRFHLQGFFQEFLYHCSRRGLQSIFKFLEETPEVPFERIIQWDIGVRDALRDVYASETIEFSSANWCCRFVSQPSVVVPQRLTKSLTVPYPLLAVINEIELDAYYIT